MGKHTEKEWNGGAVASLILIIGYILTIIALMRINFMVNGIITNSMTIIILCFLGMNGMYFAFKNFREKNYSIAKVIYFISIIPAIIIFMDGIFVTLILSIFVLFTNSKTSNKKKKIKEGV